ncbi:Nuclear pore complex protein Nup54 [Geodia barretti]|uniref:Nuclear pore complex protein Nup54 n=1 Tax=Geodia barretti TaxID=519541 RepID=A0AA35TNR7_GEOBA|nr:Nuclear pore complex protein Nup54 [Geodia barretti]
MQGGGLQLGGMSGGLKLNLGQPSGLMLGGANTATTSSLLGTTGQQPRLGTGGFGTGVLGTGGLGTGGLGTGGFGTGGLGTGGFGTGGLGTGGFGTGALGTGGLGTGLGMGGLGTGGLGTGGFGMGGLGTGGLGTGGLGLGTGGLGTGGLKGIGTGIGLGGLNTQKGGGMLSQPQSTDFTALQAQQQLNHGMLTMVNAVRSPAIFDDDRDQVVTRFNVLQACSGVGKGIARVEGYSDLQSVDFTPENPFCKFKTLCYNRLPSSRNEDGMVTLQFNKPDSVLMSQQETLVKELQTIVSAATVQVVVNTIRPLPDNCSELTLYMTEKSFMGTRRLLAADVYVFLNNRKANLEKLGVTGLYPKTGFTEGNLKLYLQNPPSGITAQMWEESKSTNPDSQKYIPVAILGSKDLLKRAKHQQQETKQHQSRLEVKRELS